MNTYRLIVVFLLVSASFALRASEISIATGFSSDTQGRAIPLAAGAIHADSLTLLGHSFGTRTEYSYLSSYSLNAFYNFKPIRSMGGDFVAHFGGSIYYYKIGTEVTEGESLEEESDFTLGPGYLLQYRVFDMFFLGVHGIFGMKGVLLVPQLVIQDVTNLIVGVRF